MRHVSGQHIKEFKDFLSKFPDEFVGKHWFTLQGIMHTKLKLGPYLVHSITSSGWGDTFWIFQMALNYIEKYL